MIQLYGSQQYNKFAKLGPAVRPDYPVIDSRDYRLGIAGDQVPGGVVRPRSSLRVAMFPLPDKVPIERVDTNRTLSGEIGEVQAAYMISIAGAKQWIIVYCPLLVTSLG